GSSLGAVAGARFAKSLVPLGPQMLMGVAVVILLLCASLMMAAARRPLSTSGRQAALEVSAPLAQEGAFQLLFRDKYLLLIAGMVIFLNWVNSSGEYVLDRALLVAAKAA